MLFRGYRPKGIEGAILVEVIQGPALPQLLLLLLLFYFYFLFFFWGGGGAGGSK